MKPRPMCTENCYCPIYCNPFAMSWFGAHLCSPWLTCSMSKSNGAKESCDVLCWCSCVVVLLSFNNLSLCLLSSSKKSPEQCWSSYSNDIFHSPMTNLAKFFLLEVLFVHIFLLQSLTDGKKFAAAISHCAEHGKYICPYKRAWWTQPLMCRESV